MKYLTLLFILLFSFSAFGQNKPVLTNESIIELVNAGVSDVIIIAKIKSSDANFDTSTDALIKLKNNKVSDNVQAAMFERGAAMDEQATKDSVVEMTTDVTENGTLSEIADKTRVFLTTEDFKARETMIKELSKYPRLQSVDKPENADFILAYGIAGTFANGNFVGEVGDLVAITRGSKDAQGKTRVRIHYSVRITQETLFDLNPAKSTMRRFIKEFKKVRNE